MKARLKDIAAIQLGYSFRERLESVPTGAVAVIQMKDLVGDEVDCSGLLRVDMERPGSHLVSVGDLIFRSRGATNTCAILAEDPVAAVVAAPLFRIRVTDKRVLPRYLVWYMNQVPAQTHLGSHVRGTAQKMISKDSLENLDIPVPPLERQHEIVEAATLAEREQQIMAALAEKRKQFMAARLLALAEGEASR